MAQGEHYAATRSEYAGIKAQLESEHFPPSYAGGSPQTFQELPYEERQKLLKDRLKKYSQKVRGCVLTTCFETASCKRWSTMKGCVSLWKQLTINFDHV